MRNGNFSRIAALILAMVFNSSATGWAGNSLQCNYNTWEWDVKNKKSVGHRRVSKARAELSSEEKGDVPGCSVCEEDQVSFRIQELPMIQVCEKYAEQFRTALAKALAAGFQIHSLVGYRVGRTRGGVDEKGLRVGFSNHSYGIAIDVNSESNGLYDACDVWSDKCRLIRGGAYNPTSPNAITKESVIYKSMLESGFKWGGEILGRQKDFMHFSISGY